MSLDGYAAGPNQSLEHPLGVGGERLHEWVFAVDGFRERHGPDATGEEDDPVDAAFIERGGPPASVQRSWAGTCSDQSAATG